MAQQGVFTIDPVVMQNTAQTIGSQWAIIENCLNSIKQSATSLKYEWEGDSATAYQTAISKIAEDSPKLVSILKEYVIDLNDIARKFIAEENKRSAANAALPNDVFGGE